ncbi:MAG: hypothetical protein LAP21_21015 [Acidobacteriia bacterium]|nr:hypothetical protein [Terriglobia bacterium]
MEIQVVDLRKSDANSTRPVPEWGVSRGISVAVPLVVSGSQFKNNQRLGTSMNMLLRERMDPSDVKEFLEDLKTNRKIAKKKAVVRAKVRRSASRKGSGRKRTARTGRR